MAFSRRFRSFLFPFSVVCFLSNWLEWPLAIRSSFVPFNAVAASVLSLLVPCSAIALGDVFVSRFWRRLTISIGVFLLLPFGICAFFILVFGCFLGASKEFELQESLTVGWTSYRAYIDYSGGAFAPPYSLVRRELDLTPGLKLVQRRWGDLHYGNMILRRTADSHLEIVIDGEVRGRLNL